MKKNIDYWEEDVNVQEKVELSAWELSELIDQRLENRPRGKPSKSWKNELNGLIDEYNHKYGKSYTRV